MPAEDWHDINAFLAAQQFTHSASIVSSAFEIDAYLHEGTGAAEEVVITIHTPPPPPPLSAFSLLQAG